MNPSDADRNVGVDGNVDKSVIVTGDHNSVSYVTMQAIKKHWLIAVVVLLSMSVATGAFLVRGQNQQQAAADETTDAVHAVPGLVEERVRGAVNDEILGDPDVLTGLLKAKIRERTDEEITAIKAQLDYDWRDAVAVERRRDTQLDLVDELVAKLRDRLSGDVDPVFVEAAKLLANQGVDEAIEYLEAKRESILKDVDQLNDRQTTNEVEKRAKLESVLFDAELREANLEWEEAVEIYEMVLERAPNWSRVHGDLAASLFRLRRLEKAERHMDKARVLAADDSLEKADALNGLALVRLQSPRSSSIVETEKMIRQALQIDRALLARSDEADSDQAEACAVGRFRIARDLTTYSMVQVRRHQYDAALVSMAEAVHHVEDFSGDDRGVLATILSNQADLLTQHGRFGEAEEKIRRVLSIDCDFASSSPGRPNPEYGIHLSNMAVLMAQTARANEAEWLLRAAIEHNEKLYGPDDVHLARDLFSLAELLGQAGRLDHAGLLTTRALILGHRAYGDRHPFVGTCLRGTGNWFFRNGQHSESMQLLMHAIRIHEMAGDTRAPELSRDFNSLAMALHAYLLDKSVPPYIYFSTAESLYRRSLNGFEAVFSRDHPEFQTTLNNFKQMLFDFQLAGPVESQRVEDVLQPPDADGLNRRGLVAFWRNSYDDAYVLFQQARQEASLNPEQVKTLPAASMNEAMALRELGRVSLAIKQLESLLDDFPNDPSSAFARGRTNYHLALSHWYLDDREAAIESCKASTAAYGEITDEFESVTQMKEETLTLCEWLNNGHDPDPAEPLDATQLIKDAKQRLDVLHDLSFDFEKRAGDMIRKVHGDVTPLEELLSEFTRVVEEFGPEGSWLIAPDEAVSPHLDDYLGEIPDDAIERIITNSLPVGRDVD